MCNSAGAYKVIEPGESVGIDEVIDDDIYITGGNVLIQGTILGDVVAAGGTVDISGNVTGDIIAAAGTVTINGNVGDDARIGTGNLIVHGHVADDLITGAGSVLISDTASIGGELVFGAGQVDVKGDVKGGVHGAGGQVSLGGNVGGDVELEVDDLTVLPTARINGTLTYNAPAEAAIPPGTVMGNTDFTPREPEKEPEKGIVSSFVWLLVRYLALLIVGLVCLAVFPKRTAAAANAIPENPLMNLAVGLVLVIAGFIGSMLLFIVILGIPLGIILLFATIAVLYTSRLFFGLWLGRLIFSWLKKESRPWMDMSVGLFVVFLAASIPWIGFIIFLLVSFIAVGALYKEQRRYYLEMKGNM